MKKETDIEKLYTGDRIGLTAVELFIILESFAQSVAEKARAGELKGIGDITRKAMPTKSGMSTWT